MPFFFMLVGLVFLIIGSIGLFHANVNMSPNPDLHLYANLTFGMFVFLGAAVLLFLAIFNREID
jgi:hypothetical protein